MTDQQSSAPDNRGDNRPPPPPPNYPPAPPTAPGYSGTPGSSAPTHQAGAPGSPPYPQPDGSPAYPSAPGYPPYPASGPAPGWGYPGAPGGYPAPGSGYPAPSGGYPGGGPAPVRPAAVEWTFRLMLVRSVLGLIGIFVALALRNSLRAQISQQQLNAGNSTVNIDAIVNAAIIGGIIFSAVYLVLYVLLAVQVRAGRQWARVVTWVLAGFGVFGLLFSFVSSAVPLSRAISIASGLLDIAIIVLLALRASSAYFAAAKAHRRR